MVFEEVREERKDARLDRLVEDGTLTEEQRSLLEAKMDEVHEEIEALKSEELTTEERRAEMRSIRDEMRAWAEENGITLPELHRGRFGKGHGRGMMMEEDVIVGEPEMELEN